MSKNQKGFTLVELLVVIAIIGTLSGIVLVSLGSARGKARDAVRQSDMRQMVSAQELYYSDNDAYLTNDGTGTGLPAIGTYIQSIDDPLSSQSYVWVNNTAALDCTNGDYDANAGQWFCAYATLEEESATPATKTMYFVATHLGSKKLDLAAVPSVTSDCTCFIWQ